MRRVWQVALALVLIAVLTAGGLAYAIWRAIHEPYLGHEAAEKIVDVKSGTTVRSILRLLENEGVVSDARLARLYLVYGLDDPPLKAGEYRFVGAAAIPAVLDRMIRGEVVTYPVTLVEGWTKRETATRLADAGFGDFHTLLEEMSRPDLIADLDPLATDLEGYLFPDTYNFARGTAERQIVGTLVTTFRQRWRDSVAPLRADGDSTADSLSIREIVTLASLVETEARIDE